MDSFILDEFCWSFSKIETFERCPKCFDLQYVKCLQGMDGAFGQFGTLCHQTLEKYLKGKLMEFELADEYINSFDKIVTEKFPPQRYGDMRTSYYNAGLDYFSNFNGFDNINILKIENKHYFKVDKYDFVGIIDLETDNSIIDHKTKGAQHLKRLTKKHADKDMLTMIDGRFIEFSNFIQLYIYCIPYYNKYKKYPEYLSLNMLKIQDWYTIKFDETYFNKAIKWCVDEIEKIYNTKNFIKGDDVDSFWCNNTCGQRLNCKYSDRYLGV